MCRRKPRYETKIAAIGVPVAKHSAREIATSGVNAAVSPTSVLRNCFLIVPREI